MSNENQPCMCISTCKIHVKHAYQQAGRRVHRCSVSCVSQTLKARNDLGDFVRGLHITRERTETQINVFDKITVSDRARLFLRCSDFQAPGGLPVPRNVRELRCYHCSFFSICVSLILIISL